VKNRHVISEGLITCTVSSNDPLPVGAYPYLQRLAQVITEVAAEIERLIHE